MPCAGPQARDEDGASAPHPLTHSLEVLQVLLFVVTRDEYVVYDINIHKYMSDFSPG